MSLKIESCTKIADILTCYPETKGVFAGHGMGALATEDGMRVLAPFLTLGTALRSRGFDEKIFLRLLEENIAIGDLSDAPGLEEYSHQRDLTLLALMPCGLKMPFGRTVTTFLEALKKEGLDIRYAVEGNVNQELSYYSFVQTLETLDELPDIVVSADFNAFYSRAFQEKFVKTGDLCGYGRNSLPDSFVQAGIMDPLEEYTILGVNPLVMVVNLDELNGRSLPTSWDDILDPQWHQSITLRGNEQFFCHAVLLPTFRKHGAEGLKKLAANVLRGLHPAQMVKQMDAGAPGAIYVMPEFFAYRAKKQEKLAIVWPEEGALASPVTLQVKRSKIDELRPVLDYLTGSELAGKLSGARFPVPHSEVGGDVQQKPLWWIGWDFFRNNDLLEVNREIDDIFLPNVRQILLKKN